MLWTHVRQLKCYARYIHLCSQLRNVGEIWPINPLHVWTIKKQDLIGKNLKKGIKKSFYIRSDLFLRIINGCLHRREDDMVHNVWLWLVLEDHGAVPECQAGRKAEPFSPTKLTACQKAWGKVGLVPGHGG